MEKRLQLVLAQSAGLVVDLSELDEDDDLYAAGLTSLATVAVMLALEDEFEVEFDADMLTKSTFESVEAIRRALVAVGAELGDE